jgi:hypothetical protein
VSRFTFHIVWLIVSIGSVSAVYGGPLWAYPVALLLAMILSAFVTAYPTDNSLRRTQAAFGGLMALGASTRFMMVGFTSLAVHESLSILMFGVACVWASVFPHRDISLEHQAP